MRHGYIYPDNRMGEAAQRKMLLEAGIPEKQIYVEGKPEGNDWQPRLSWLVDRKLRPGYNDTLEVAYLHRLAWRSSRMVDTIDNITARDTIVVEVGSGARSDKPGPFARAIHDSMLFLSGKTGRADRSTIGKLGAAASPVTKPKNARLPDDQALVIWRNPALTSAEAVATMNAVEKYKNGWSYASAYRHLGPRGTPTGKRTAARMELIKKQRARLNPKGQIYFAQVDGRGPIKIGFSIKVNSRLASLRIGTAKDLRLLRTMDGTPRHERELHARFHKYRIRGEWFRFTGELRDFVQSLPINND